MLIPPKESSPILNQTFGDLQTYIQTLENQSFISGETWATIKVLCTFWPILATSKFAGKNFP